MAESPTEAPTTVLPQGFFGLLALWPQGAAVVAGATVVLSVLYNWAYFQVGYPAGMQLMTITDHVAAALVWLPQGVIFYISGITGHFIGALFVKPGEAQRSAVERPHRFTVTTLCLLIGLVVATDLFSAPVDFWTVVPAAALLAIFIVSTLRSRGHLSGEVAALLLVGITLCMYALSEGNRKALADFTATAGNATVLLNQGPQIGNVLVLSQLDKGALIRDVKDGRVTFIRWEDIKEVTVASATLDQRWRICKYFGVFCGPHSINYGS